MSDKPTALSKLRNLSTDSLMHFGIWLEIIGIVIFSAIFLTKLPLVMVFAIPVGAGLLGIGLLCWFYCFIKTLK